MYLRGTVFAIVVMSIAVALLLGMPALLALLLVTAALCGYGMLVMRQHLRLAEPALRPLMRRSHGRQLGVVAAIGLSLGSMVLVVPARPGFAVLLVLALLVAAGMGLVIRGLSKASG